MQDGKSLRCGDRRSGGEGFLEDNDEEERLGGQMWEPCNEADNQNRDVSGTQWDYDQYSGEHQFGYDGYSRGYEGQGNYQPQGLGMGQPKGHESAPTEATLLLTHACA